MVESQLVALRTGDRYSHEPPIYLKKVVDKLYVNDYTSLHGVKCDHSLTWLKQFVSEYTHEAERNGFESR